MERKDLWYTVQRWRRERALANEQGYASPPLIDVIPEDEEITLFDSQRVPYTPEDYDPSLFAHEVAMNNTIYAESVTFKEDPRLKID